MAGRAHGVFPILAAFRADPTSVECIPDAPARRHAHPAIKWTRNPFALRTKYFHFSHIKPR